MKTATYFLGALIALFLVADATACPPSPIGKIRVMDQFGKPISGAKVYHYSSALDSFVMRNSYKYVNEEWEPDSTQFLAYGYYWGYKKNENSKAADYTYRVCAPGYADVLIASVDYSFSHEEGSWRLPLLEVVLYAKQLVKTDQNFHIHDVFIVSNEVVVNDSLRLDKKSFLKEIQETPAERLMEQVTVRAFPNPVVNELHIEFSKPQTSSNRFVLHDANGKLVHEEASEASKFDLLMNWYAPGTYFLTIYDSGNSPILRQQIVHQ